MRIRKLLLTTTSLCLLAFTPLSAIAQDAELVAAYAAYVEASSGTDADAKAAAEAAFLVECGRVGTPELEACIALATSAAVAAQAEPTTPVEPTAPADAAPAATDAPATTEQPPAATTEQAPAATTEAPATEQTAPAATEANPAENPELVAAFGAYVTASQGTDDAAKASAEAAFLAQCNALGITTLEECVAVMGGMASATTEQPATTAPAAGEPATTTDGQPAEVVPMADNPDAPAASVTDSGKPGDGDGAAATVAADAPVVQAPATSAEAQPETVTKDQIEADLGTTGEITTTLQAEAIPNAQPATQTNNNSFVININAQINIFTPYKDRDRIGRDGDEIVYERLDNGRYRQTVTRENGTRIITVWNRFGEIERRIKITPDGDRIVLIYFTGDRDGDWRDPGDDLPPFRLNIPVNEYVFYAENEDEDDIEDFLLLPPLEVAARVYSVDEVKQSARLRDTVRRVEIGDLTFNTDESTVEQDQVGSLTKVAAAMKKILDANPSEVFLIEGHTDAVGDDEPNLVLSDARAETVANLLSEFYGIDPENLTTQGYGERYLKVETEDEERANRRVTIRRITNLVAPTES